MRDNVRTPLTGASSNLTVHDLGEYLKCSVRFLKLLGLPEVEFLYVRLSSYLSGSLIETGQKRERVELWACPA